MDSLFFFKKKTISCLLLFALLIYVILLEPFLIRINIVPIKKNPFSEFFANYKTILISDIHVSLLGLRENILLNKINEISPDIIFLTGDYVSWRGHYNQTFSFLSKLKAKVGVFGVLGDSDYQDSRKSCIFCHNFFETKYNHAVKFFIDEAVFLPVEKSQYVISGIDVIQKGFPHYKKKLKGNPSYPKIILSHHQLNLNDLPDKPIFVLSGDTHGGQTYIPDIFWKKLWSPSKGEVRKGMIEKDNKKLFVTSGIGTNRFPFRFLCPPEIVLFRGDTQYSRKKTEVR